MKRFKTKAIILKSENIFEKDKRVEFLSDTGGKNVALAKRIQSSKKSYNGFLEPFNVVELSLSKGKSFYYIDQCYMITIFPNIRSDFNKISLAAYFVDVIRKNLVIEQKNQALFDLLQHYLSQINEASGTLAPILNSFHLAFLKTEGLSPEKTGISQAKYLAIIQDYCGKRLTLPTFI
jgi:DNA repair protein RecO (recombination protein O)